MEIATNICCCLRYQAAQFAMRKVCNAYKPYTIQFFEAFALYSIFLVVKFLVIFYTYISLLDTTTSFLAT